MKLKTTDDEFNRVLKAGLGNLYNKEVATVPTDTLNWIVSLLTKFKETELLKRRDRDLCDRLIKRVTKHLNNRIKPKERDRNPSGPSIMGKKG